MSSAPSISPAAAQEPAPPTRDEQLQAQASHCVDQLTNLNLRYSWGLAVTTGIQTGRDFARRQHAADKGDFVNFSSVYPNSVQEAPSRELPHMRKMVSECMRGVGTRTSPYLDGVVVQARTPRPLVEWRMIQGNRVRERPNLYKYVTHGLNVVVVNWSTPYNSQLLHDAGFSCLPCANQECRCLP